MAAERVLPLIVVDIGNTRVKLGLFELPAAEPLPHPARTVSLSPKWNDEDLAAFLPDGPRQFQWVVASVNRPVEARLLAWLEQAGATRVRQVDDTDMPLVVELERPDQVGIDRLADAVAANRLRHPGEPAIVIDMGSALTVNLVNDKGAFAGGAILPGIGTSARALMEFTDMLPLVDVSETPPALGTSTIEAIRSGLYWGAVGSVRELVEQLSKIAPGPEIFLTGGAGPLFADVLRAESSRPPQFVPHLTLAGIAIAALAPRPPKGSS